MEVISTILHQSCLALFVILLMLAGRADLKTFKIPNQIPVAIALLMPAYGLSADGPFPWILSLAANPALLASADHLAIISDMNLAAVRDVLRLKTLSDASNSGRPVTVIARSAGSREATELTRKEFEKGLQLKVNHTLPRDLKNLSEAAKSGCAVTASAPKSELSKAIGGLAIELSGRSETFHKNSSLWRRLVKRGS